MTDALILFTAAIVAYIYLRSHGGKGLSINAKLAPSSTHEGKRDRRLALGVLAFLATAVTFVLVRKGTNAVFSVIIPLLIGAIVFLAPYLNKKKSKTGK